MIRLDDVCVRFTVKKNVIEAVKNVSLSIGRGEVYGIVGSSGAGKSTLLRTINLLEKPVSGEVLINNVKINDFKGEQLRKVRLKIGMIFQHYNLINTKTVFDNVSFAMRVAGKSKEERETHIPEILSLVGLEDKTDSYPSNLSGGQKQRVGIARAIANNPDILLCDEPTSALDLETTSSILDLIKDINKKMGITTVLISHEMNIVKKICDKVAVMENGYLVEHGSVYEVFTNPRHDFTKQLIEHTINLDIPDELLEIHKGKLVRLIFKGDSALEPVISETIKNFNVTITILHGKIEYISGRPIGILVIGVDGEETNIEKSINNLKERVSELELI
ncbi:MAG: ATP-binding cassette domain-containing protein [Ignavibacteriaceae bacterium]|jgi:D-methionine transport system ATP-binding protein